MANVLVLVNPATLQILSTKDYIASFELFSEHQISYLPEIPPPWLLSEQKVGRTEQDYSEILSGFDAVVITQHLRPCFDGWINENLNNALLKFKGSKVIFLHDEYDYTEKTRAWIEEQSVDLVYTVVPDDHVAKVYEPGRFPHTLFRSILTGYLPLKFSDQNSSTPIADREHLLVYRGRVSPESYGELAKQKETIGRFFDAYCSQHDFNADIQWEEAERVYGLDWYRLLATGVATLGTESGSNVFDEFGYIRKHVDEGRSLPGPKNLNFREENLGFKMNQISPRLFEAIGCGTGLVLYEGDYSNILEAGEHFIAVKHDHSNVSDVMDQLQDSKLIQAVVDRAWEHVASNNEMHFEHLISMFDADLKDRLKTRGVSSGKQQATSPNLLVGDFSDVSATGIGVFSALHKEASTFQRVITTALPSGLKATLVAKLSRFPRLKKFLKRVVQLVRDIRS
ncbi:MAG: glycosyltransferase [Pseudomonadota bacterium]